MTRKALQLQMSLDPRDPGIIDDDDDEKCYERYTIAFTNMMYQSQHDLIDWKHQNREQKTNTSWTNAILLRDYSIYIYTHKLKRAPDIICVIR